MSAKHEAVRQNEAINRRYTALSGCSCNLSCGGALGLSGPRQAELCADLGSGRGGDVLRLARLVGPEGFVYGIDLSDGMVRAAREEAARRGAGNVRFIQAPLDAIPLPDGLLDLVLSNCTINHAEDKPAVWAEVHRLLKPGGRFVVSDIYALSEVPPAYRRDPRAVAECWAGADTRAVYLTTLEEAGFERLAILEESTPYPKGAVEVASFTIRGFKPC
ncbi:MAG: methyltransferase domain-containing protein [Spirochaetota bacterium]